MNHIETQGAVSAIVLIVGKLLHDWPSFPNWAIPHVCTATGAVLGFALGGRNLMSAVAGAVAGAAATGIHQVIDQTRKLDDK